MTTLHGLFGESALAFAVVLAMSAALTWLIGTRPVGLALSRVVDALIVIAAGLVVLALFLGPVLLAMGKRPNDMLHILYAFVAVFVVPASVALGIRAEHGSGKAPVRYGWIALGGVVLAAIAWLLFISG